MPYLINSIILRGLKNSIYAYKVYDANRKIFDGFVKKHIPSANVRNASITLIDIADRPSYITDNRIDNWSTYLANLENSVSSSTIIRSWINVYQQEFQDTHFIPSSMPRTFWKRPKFLNLIFYWLLHSLWFDLRLLGNVWRTFDGIFNLIKELVYSPYNSLMNEFKRWVLINGLITVVFEILLYINMFTLFLYLLFILIPRIINKGAVGSPILILLFHLCVLILVVI